MLDTLNINTELAAKADALFRELGLDLPTAVRLFLLQALREGGLPFTPRLNALGNCEKSASTLLQKEHEKSRPAAQCAKENAQQGENLSPYTAEEPLPEAKEKYEQKDTADNNENNTKAEDSVTAARKESGGALPSAVGENPFTTRESDDIRRAFASAQLIGAQLRRIRSLNRLYAIGERNPNVQGWREVYISGDEPFALDFGIVRVELGFHDGGSLRMMDGRLPDNVLEADAVYPRDLSAVFSSVIGQALVDVSRNGGERGQEREELHLHFANGCTLVFAPNNDWGALWLADAQGSVMFAPEAVWLRVLDGRDRNFLR